MLALQCALIAAALCPGRQSHAGNARCHDSEVLSYYYSLYTHVENASQTFLVPGSLSSDHNQARLLGKPSLLERDNLWESTYAPSSRDAALQHHAAKPLSPMAVIPNSG